MEVGALSSELVVLVGDFLSHAVSMAHRSLAECYPTDIESRAAQSLSRILGEAALVLARRDSQELIAAQLSSSPATIKAMSGGTLPRDEAIYLIAGFASVCASINAETVSHALSSLERVLGAGFPDDHAACLSCIGASFADDPKAVLAFALAAASIDSVG